MSLYLGAELEPYHNYIMRFVTAKISNYNSFIVQ